MLIELNQTSWLSDIDSSEVIGIDDSSLYLTNDDNLVVGVIRNLAKRSYDELAHIFLTASIPRVVDFYGFHEAWPAVYRTIRYQYFDRVDRKDKVGMLQQMLQVLFSPFRFSPSEPNSNENLAMVRLKLTQINHQNITKYLIDGPRVGASHLK